jgi:hypothetical protein
VDEDHKTQFDLFLEAVRKLPGDEQVDQLIEACRMRFAQDTTECEAELIGPPGKGIIDLKVYPPGARVFIPLSWSDAVAMWEELGRALGKSEGEPGGGAS